MALFFRESVIKNQHGLGASELDFLNAILAVYDAVAHRSSGEFPIALPHRDRSFHRYFSGVNHRLATLDFDAIGSSLEVRAAYMTRWPKPSPPSPDTLRAL